ncbi:sulfate transporter CysZ [Pseudocolwellia agarivorans]|uniref:sulfate transporter CysZ n=1 Tax=Pseudocolwellia agarivorans TaxID=1911682 RepID=UPI00098712A2|nr:sulfate transporter CysZ [Pseudocolwellia agarivorans]
MQHNTSSTQNTSGAGYFFKGFDLIQQKGIKRFVFVPLFINLILFGVAFYYLYLQLDHYMAMFTQWLPSWLTWLSTVLWPFVLIAVVVLFSFIFSTAANWLAAPFNGLLSEKVEAMLTGEPTPDGGFSDIIKDIPRTVGREWTKLCYYVPRALGFLLIMFILPVIGQVIWFIFVAWMMAVQYKDYPFDNHKISFTEMKNALKEKQGLSYGFGFTVAIFSMLPVVNLIVMPVAICGATNLWVDHYRKSFIR